MEGLSKAFKGSKEPLPTGRICGSTRSAEARGRSAEDEMVPAEAGTED